MIIKKILIVKQILLLITMEMYESLRIWMLTIRIVQAEKQPTFRSATISFAAK